MFFIKNNEGRLSESAVTTRTLTVDDDGPPQIRHITKLQTFTIISNSLFVQHSLPRNPPYH